MVYFWDALILFAPSFNTVFDTIYEFLKVLHTLVEWCVRAYSNGSYLYFDDINKPLVPHSYIQG